MDTTKELNRKIFDTEYASFEIDGSGKLVIKNTGGSSASEGGMGSSSDDDTAKGDLAKEGEKSGTKSTDNTDDKWDPIGKNIKEKENDANKN